MLDWIPKQALEWLKTPAHYFLPLFAASFFGLFAPLDALEFLGIAFWRNEGKPYLGSIFILSFAVVGVHYSISVVKWIVGKYHYFITDSAAKSRLKELTPKEQELLSGYLKANNKTQLLWLNDGVVRGLVASKIIYPATPDGVEYSFPFNIQPWAWRYLKKNPHLVGVQSVSDVIHKLSNNSKQKGATDSSVSKQS